MLPSPLCTSSNLGKLGLVFASETVYATFKLKGEEWKQKAPGPRTRSTILTWKTEMGGTGLQLKCYLDASLHNKKTVFGFSL